MMVHFDPSDGTLLQETFIRDEVRYNLLHLVLSGEDSLRIRSDDGQLIFGKTPGQYNAWLWVSGDAGEERRRALIGELAEQVSGLEIPGVTGDIGIAEEFAKLYGEPRNLAAQPFVKLVSYACTELKPPQGVAGQPVPVGMEDRERVARYLADFDFDAFGRRNPPELHMGAAESYIRQGDLLFWKVDGEPVSMARIVHRSDRYARIAYVYTPPEYRGRGYAGALTAELSEVVLREGRIPMLYADATNPVSNRLYRNLGYKESGSVTDLAFVQRPV